MRVVLRHFHPTFNNFAAVSTLHRRPHGSVPWRRQSFDRGDAVLHRLLHLLERAHVDLAHALARDAEFGGQIRKRDRVLGEPTRFEDTPLAIVEHGKR